VSTRFGARRDDPVAALPFSKSEHPRSVIKGKVGAEATFSNAETRILKISRKKAWSDIIKQMFRSALCVLLLATSAWPADGEKDLQAASFELVWSTLRDRYWDPTMAGRNWRSIHDAYRSQIEKAKTREEAGAVLRRMIRELPSSHLAIIPAALYRFSVSAQAKGIDKTKEDEQTDDDSGAVGVEIVAVDRVLAVERIDPNGSAAKAGVHPGWIIQSVDGMAAAEFLKNAPSGLPEDRQQFAQLMLDRWLHGPKGSTVKVEFRNTAGEPVMLPLVWEAPAGELVEFGNLPPEHVIIEHHLLPDGAGYIRLNLFLDPVLVMPEIALALQDFRNARGIVIDLRGNPGGLGVMAMGIAGWFISKHGQRLGTMVSRDGKTPFEINPRLEAYGGRLAILVDRGSASTTEILAQGLQDLGRARVFGTHTAGAALPSEIVQLPNGDRFQYPEANYISMKGRVLEGNGVEPDVVVRPTLAALKQGRDLPLEHATAWIKAGDASGKRGNAR